MFLQHSGQAGFVTKCAYLEAPTEKEFLLDYIARNNENPRPFVWTKGPENLQRIIEATKEYQATHPRKPKEAPPAPSDSQYYK